MSGNSTFGRGLCKAPFLQDTFFPDEGGFVTGRFCSKISASASCCLPCPSTDWLYPDNFKVITSAPNWINVVGLTFSVFLLLSWAFLPPSKTARHYLSICLVLATMMIGMGFIIPLAAKPTQCFDAITPNSMKTSPTCALSGAFVLAGGWAGVMWVFMRALALHLQICWQVVIGKAFMWGALAAGWGIPSIGLAVAMIFSGVSFRFGETCHINHKNSMADFWIPLLAFAGITLVIQFSTFGYCIKVYLASLSDESTTTNSSGLPSYATSSRAATLATVTPRQAYRRVRRVIELQWRGIFVVLIIIADVIFFAVVFVYMDDTEARISQDPAKTADWLKCLVVSGGNKNKCLNLAASLVINEATVMAVLVLLSMNGIWCTILLGRWSMVTGWIELVRGKIQPETEFVSADVRTLKIPNAGNYEMLSRDRDHIDNDKTQSHSSTVVAPLSPVAQLSQDPKISGRETPDFFGREARYKSPTRSFSSPKPPNTYNAMRGWDSQASHAMPHPQPQYQPQYQHPQQQQFYPGMDPLSMNKI